jgi:hypothetical protein
MPTKSHLKKAREQITKELGYEAYNDGWGNEHLLNGPHGDYFFDSTSQQMFAMLVSCRAKYLMTDRLGRDCRMRGKRGRR